MLCLNMPKINYLEVRLLIFEPMTSYLTTLNQASSCLPGIFTLLALKVTEIHRPLLCTARTKGLGNKSEPRRSNRMLLGARSIR